MATVTQPSEFAGQVSGLASASDCTVASEIGLPPKQKVGPASLTLALTNSITELSQAQYRGLRAKYLLVST